MPTILASSATAPFKLTDNQIRYVRALRNPEKPVVVVTGPAGSGKTKLAVEVGMEQLRTKSVQRLILTRPLVTAGEDLGFMPGNLYSKMQPWMAPILDAVADSPFNASIVTQLNTIQQNGPAYVAGSGHSGSSPTVEVVPLAFMRGRTFQNAWIICDEAQNCTAQQLLMLLTRLGQGSKMVITADPAQSDVPSFPSSGNRVSKNAAVSNMLCSLDASKNEVLKRCVVHAQLDSSDIKRHEIIPHLMELF